MITMDFKELDNIVDGIFSNKMFFDNSQKDYKAYNLIDFKINDNNYFDYKDEDSINITAEDKSILKSYINFKNFYEKINEKDIEKSILHNQVRKIFNQNFMRFNVTPNISMCYEA